MSFSEIAEAIGENVENAGGSVIQLGGEQLTVRAAGRVQTVEEIEQLPLKFGSRATPLRVRDVARWASARPSAPARPPTTARKPCSARR
jgi:cobalt-zinc-cadmium resistance protein CzcA